jgi:hypothetical protein
VETGGGTIFCVFPAAPTQAFATHCAANQITPHWDAWADNSPSVAVAEKTGFRKIESYSILVATPDIKSPPPISSSPSWFAPPTIDR